MRFVPVLVVAGALALLAGVSPANAFAVPSGTDVRGGAPVIEVAGRRCGSGRHWVAAHRNRHGVRVSGRCVANRHRR